MPGLADLASALVASTVLVLLFLCTFDETSSDAAVAPFFTCMAGVAWVSSKILKKLLRQPRPVGSKEKDSGMPSSHAVTIAYLTTASATGLVLLACVSADSSPPAALSALPRSSHSQKQPASYMAGPHFMDIIVYAAQPSSSSSSSGSMITSLNGNVLIQVMSGMLVLIGILLVGIRVCSRQHTAAQVIVGYSIGVSVFIAAFIGNYVGLSPSNGQRVPGIEGECNVCSWVDRTVGFNVLRSGGRLATLSNETHTIMLRMAQVFVCGFLFKIIREESIGIYSHFKHPHPIHHSKLHASLKKKTN